MYKQFNPKEILFIKLCKGLVTVCDRINHGQPAYIVDAAQPFPQPLYEAFQSLSLKWLLQGDEPKGRKMKHPSILCLIEAARKSTEAIDPDFAELVDFPGEPLIEELSRPSEECEAWASEYALNLERDQNQSYILDLMNEIRRLSLPDSVYVSIRRFIAEHPFPSEFEIARFRSDNPEIESVQDFLMQAYREAPPQSSTLPLCKTCGGYLDCAAAELGYCKPLTEEVSRAPIEDTVICLIRPSLLELRLAKTLQDMGLTVELWPQLDQADLKVTFPNGEIWAVDAKDWGSATKLVHTLGQDEIPDIGQSTSFFIVPDYRWNNLAYQATIEAQYVGEPPILSESELVKQAKRALL
ncbi:hypothetical protein [Acaryochloris sp. CCMEE 5410]|uniref:restriction endonuclease-related protein n=1 Tax=Acaryochloris sp. CCMEE 5410 TaxID=310037 RepID=UPI0002484333|nr:hypothetical protein [Acaryochloris sp. CCMEE 5410]KAI9133103.1 hypothetical protein ON05_007075 [Acaryochloris sp. CCMEE 5410]